MSVEQSVGGRSIAAAAEEEEEEEEEEDKDSRIEQIVVNLIEDRRVGEERVIFRDPGAAK